MKKTFRVADMHCANCAMKIESIEDELHGVRSVSASYRNLQVTIEFDESKIADQQLIDAIKRKGYTVTFS